MPDFVSFNEGRRELAVIGLPPTCWFLLSTISCEELKPSDTLAGGVGEITGTGYMRGGQADPLPTLDNPTAVEFAEQTWATEAAHDWPADVRSVVMATTPDDSGKAICAWNLVAGGYSRDLSLPLVAEHFTPTLTLA